MTAASFASGVLPVGSAILFTADKPVRITSVNLFNGNAVEQTILIKAKRLGQTVRTYRRIVLAQYEAGEPMDNALSLSPGDALWGQTTTAGAVDYVVSGEVA